MVGTAVMAASSDCLYGEINQNMPSLVNMPATSLALNEKAMHYTQVTDLHNSAFETHYEVGMRSITTNAEASQELADMLRGILDEQQADQLLTNHNSNSQFNYSFNSQKAITSPNCHSYNQSISVSSPHHNPLMLDLLDAEIVHPTSKYDIASSSTLMDVESLLALSNPFNLKDGADQSLSSTNSALIDCENYSKMTCNSCSTNELSLSSTSSMPEYNSHHQLESFIDLDPSSICTSPAHSIDDYSLSTINGVALSAAVMGCTNELLPTSNDDVEGLNAGKALEIDETDNSCDDNNVIDADTKAKHDDGDNICIEDHMVSQHLNTFDGDIDKCVRDSAAINACNPGYGIMVCNEEALFPSGPMKLMQREAVYAAAAMQPVDWAGIVAVSTGARPKRRNVRISHDPQTVSARRRRERISDRIRVLQRMVPGGTKLDTASMLDEAIHYLKYLKSQVQALEWLEIRRPSPNSPSNCLPLSSSPSPHACMYPNLINTNYIQPSPSSRLMIIK